MQHQMFKGELPSYYAANKAVLLVLFHKKNEHLGLLMISTGCPKKVSLLDMEVKTVYIR